MRAANPYHPILTRAVYCSLVHANELSLTCAESGDAAECAHWIAENTNTDAIVAHAAPLEAASAEAAPAEAAPAVVVP